MSHPNENIFSCCVGGYKSERPLVLSIKIIKSKIQKAETELKDADGDDDDAKIEIKKYKRILDSTQRLNEIKKLLYRGEYDVNWRSKEFPNHSALHQAAKFGHSDIIHHLLRAGWDVNRRNEYKQTPLMMAALFGNIRCTKVLLNMGAKMFIKDKTGFTAMGYCEKNIKQKNKKEKSCTKIMSIFHDYYEKRKEALEEFKEEEENIASAQKDARQDQEVDFDDNSNDDDDELEIEEEGSEYDEGEEMGDNDDDDDGYQSFFNTY